MIEQLELLVQFYSTKWHTPISLLTKEMDIHEWHEVGIAVHIFADKNSATCKAIEGHSIVMADVLVGKVNNKWLVLYGAPRVDITSEILDQHLPRMCRAFRNGQRQALIETTLSVAVERKQELARSLRDDRYELERLCMQVMTLSRKIESDNEILKLFSRAPELIKAKATQTFVEMMKLVPSCYESIKVEDNSVIATTYPIVLEHDGGRYDFDPYTVEVRLDTGKVLISGGTEMNCYVHPHVTDDPNNICFGNISHLVSRLAGELDMHGLLQLVHQFLHSYNSSDPFQKIEKWDPNWVEDEDDEPYCSWCDDYGHDISDCESCWWCPHCNQYDDHDEDDCPNRPKEDNEEEDADAELAEDTAAAG
ncbi:MAG: hypothetical protein H6508_01780 [Calditrichaeota bacterium]|nr:hypothetical protein [Calditrichota bacterium]